MFILIYGNPVDGHRYVGPFDEREDAVRYMETEPLSENIWLAELDPPASDADEPKAQTKSDILQGLAEKYGIPIVDIKMAEPGDLAKMVLRAYGKGK